MVNWHKVIQKLRYFFGLERDPNRADTILTNAGIVMKSKAREHLGENIKSDGVSATQGNIKTVFTSDNWRITRTEIKEKRMEQGKVVGTVTTTNVRIEYDPSGTRVYEKLDEFHNKSQYLDKNIVCFEHNGVSTWVHKVGDWEEVLDELASAKLAAKAKSHKADTQKRFGNFDTDFQDPFIQSLINSNDQ